MRGDPPARYRGVAISSRSTPHARGSTLYANMSKVPSKVYPACAGIHLASHSSSVAYACLPRMRGDPPLCGLLVKLERQSTPHARGSTPDQPRPVAQRYVYPACAGIHLAPFRLQDQLSRLPRMRGDPPWYFGSRTNSSWSTPHARGSTLHKKLARYCKPVYPACAGIHRCLWRQGRKERCLPRMRGDPPQNTDCASSTILSTPHARGSTGVDHRHCPR